VSTSDRCRTQPVPFQADPTSDARLAELCKALAHPHRVHILRFLIAQETCFAGAIVDQLPVAPSTVSQHLSHLKAAGLVQGEVDGPRRCYCVAPDVLDELRTLVAALDPEAEVP